MKPRSAFGILTFCFVFAVGVVLGAVAHREGWHRALRGARSDPAPEKAAEPGWPYFMRAPTAVPDDLKAQLRAIGYLEGYESGDGNSTLLVTDLAQPGLNLHTSGHAPEARLMALDGTVIHRWRYDDPEADPELGRFWRTARLEPNGDLYAIRDYSTLYKLDVDSNLLWRFDQHSHHHLDVTEDGRVWVLTQSLGRHPAFPDQEVFDNGIAVLAPDGTLLRSISILDAFANSDFAGLLKRARELPDVLHTNTVTVLDGRLADRSPAFRAGNLLISSRNLDTVAVIDIDTERVVWALAGLWVEQHMPTIVDPSHMLVFDNAGRGGRSRAIEIDPFSQEVVWLYPDDEENPLHAVAMGEAQRLENGNTLIVESPRGHALEVTPEGQTVWEFWNPERAGDEDEFIATLPHLERLPQDLSLDWLPRPDSEP